MSTSQFWWNWWVQFGIASGTIGAVIVALFGNHLRAWLVPSKLRLGLASTTGDATREQLEWRDENGRVQRRLENARYYHLTVSNDYRVSPATNVSVILLALELQDADGTFSPVWTGDIPMKWRHGEVFPVLRTVGPEAVADLCSVVKDKWLRIHPLIVPNNLPTKFKEAATVILSLQARSNEGDSNVLKVRISWDGAWHEGAAEMTKHLVLSVVSAES